MDRMPQEIKNKIITHACDNPIDARNHALVDKSFLWQAHKCLFYYLDVATIRLALSSYTVLGYQKVHHINIVAHHLEQFPNMRYHVQAVVFHGSMLNDSNTHFLVHLLDHLPRLKQFMFRGFTSVDNTSETYLSRVTSLLILVEELGFRRCMLSKKAFDTLSSGGSY